VKRISNISSDPFQQQNVTLPDGGTCALQMKYIAQQEGWFFTLISWRNFTIKGVRITNDQNILNQWKNILPFGIACQTEGNREPTQLEDFYSGASNLFLLNSEDLEQHKVELGES
jgi:hypothetical protein